MKWYFLFSIFKCIDSKIFLPPRNIDLSSGAQLDYASVLAILSFQVTLRRAGLEHTRLLRFGHVWR